MNPPLSSLPQQPAVVSLGLTLLHFFWQGTLLALMAVIARRLLHRAPALLRRKTAITFLTASALCPFLTFFALPEGPQISHSTAPLKEAVVAAGQDTPLSSGTAVAPTLLEPTPTAGFEWKEAPLTPSGNIVGAPERQASEAAVVHKMKAAEELSSPLVNLRVLLPWLVWFWASGVALLTLRHTGGWWLMRRWQRETSPFPQEWEVRLARLAGRLGISRGVRALASSCGRGPALAGILKPVIIIPASAFTGMNPSHLEAVLLHELAHLRQRDHWVTALLTFTGTLLFYHPAIWLISAWVRAEREHAADELAVQASGDRADYVRALAVLAGFKPVPSTALAADGGNVTSRIRRLLGRCEPEPRLLGSGFLPAMAAATGALCLILPSTAQTQKQVAAPAAARVTASDNSAAEPGKSEPPSASAPSSTTPTAAPTTTLTANQPLQTQIDAAVEGAVIHLGEGAFEANLVITKPLTLEGAGEAKTFIQQKSKEAGPVISLRGVKGVTLRSLRVIALPVESDGNTLASSGSIEVEDSEFTFEKCSITGPAHNGIVLKSSAATIRDCLISGMWSNGITVGRGSHDVSITGTEVRNCFYTPIVIGRQTERVTIDRCRVSGGAWHGIRYDDSSPVITNCLIFQNARCGIYASGRTKAVVRGNVFLANEMGGMSCWFSNEDTIEENTFNGDLRENISVLGGSKPLIRHNIFADSPVAIMLGKIAEKGKESTAEAAPVIQENLFWNVPREFTRNGKDEVSTETGKPLREDPQFLDSKTGDFRLAETSPAKKQKIGAQNPLSYTGQWPLTEAEKKIIPEGKSRSYELWKTAGHQKKKDDESIQKLRQEAQTKADAWKAEALQIDSVERRDDAIAAIRAAVGSEDPQMALPGLMALAGSVAAEFDKTPFRAPVRKWMISKNAALRNAALSTMVQIGAEAGDLDALYTLAEDKDTPDRASLVIYLHWIGKGDLTGRGGKVVLELLGDDDLKRQRDVLNAIWGASFSKELEDRVVALSRTGEYQRDYDAVYYALSPQANKSAQSIDRLMEIMSGKVGGDPQRASWGLGQGVSKAEAPHLAKLAVKLFADNVSPEVRSWCLSLIKRYGSREELSFLDQTAARPAVTSTIRKAVEEARTAIAERKGENGSTVPDFGKSY